MNEKNNNTCLISQEIFMSLKKDSEILDKHSNAWTIEVADCGGPGKYPTHLFKCSSNDEVCYIFHDGNDMRILDEKNKKYDGAVCGEFTN